MSLNIDFIKTNFSTNNYIILYIFRNLKHLIHQVNHLNNSQRQMPKETLTGNCLPNYFRPPLRPFDVRPTQQPNTVVWPNILQPTNLKSAPGLPHFKSKNHSLTKLNITIFNYDVQLVFLVECFGYNHLEMIATTNRFTTLDDPQSLNDLTILHQEMDGAVAKWLHYLKLHKYQWFFNSLSYLEIEFIDEDNIDDFIAKVNKNSITKGAQKKICLSTKTLRDRSQKLNNLSLVIF